MIRSSRMPAGRRLLVLAIAALIPALAGCEAGNNAPTQEWHQPTDGIGTVHNDISIRNVFVLGAAIGSTIKVGGSAGVFLALINNGSPDRLVKISAPGTAKSVTLPGGSVRLASQQAVLLTGPAPDAPGGRTALPGLADDAGDSPGDDNEPPDPGVTVGGGGGPAPELGSGGDA